MNIFSWIFRNQERKEIVPVENPPKTYEELKKELRFTKMTIGFELQRTLGRPLPKDDIFMRRLRDTERQIIDLEGDVFTKAILKIFAKHNFDITEAIEKGYEELLTDALLEICHFLQYGSSYPSIDSAFGRRPFTANQLFIWILEQVKLGEEGSPTTCVLTGWNKVYKSGEFLDYRFDKENHEDRLILDSITSGILILVAGEFGKKFTIAADIFCEVDGGEKFIKKILAIIQQKLAEAYQFHKDTKNP